jgi:hypothetical protein
MAHLSSGIGILLSCRSDPSAGVTLYPLNNEGTKVEQDKYVLINKENIQSLQFKFSLLGHLADVVHELVVSPPTFVRDFEKHFQKLHQVQANLVTKKYATYKNSLVEKRRQARAMKVSA